MKKSFLLASFLSLFLLIHTSYAQWVQVSNGMPISSKITHMGSNTTTIYAINSNTTYSLYYSTDNGLNWIQSTLNKKLNNFSIFDNILITGSSNVFYISTNNGQNWDQSNLNGVYSVVSIFGSTAVTGTNYGIFVSTNYGFNWMPSTLNSTNASSILINNSEIFVGFSAYNGIFYSSNFGQNWSLPLMNNQSVFSLMNKNSILYAGTLHNGIFTSTNNGQNWIQNSLNNKTVNSFVYSGNHIIICTRDSGIYVSHDNGANWIKRNQGFPNGGISVYSITIKGEYIFAGTDNSSVWRRSLSEIIGIQNISSIVPSAFSLKQNYPNPFNPATSIEFDVLTESNVLLKVFDVSGRVITTLVNEKLGEGSYITDWNAENYPSGVYFYTLTAGDFKETKRMVLVK